MRRDRFLEDTGGYPKGLPRPIRASDPLWKDFLVLGLIGACGAIAAWLFG